ncbi:FKBP-type peptidyl-prolyl cis-trans isomerase [Vibrio barjaei]|uniref:FKBP-type peptidyl-prolyl cis-trans isomerase n=1 Tax=Vibrio barjaei TaxID=1676683 RepID=UPI0007BC3FC0|nr:FKBP-type peptidyl-prolyl cis-trans isomerase [Vibrio barjaei]OIN26250.1 hypothetical protein AWH66_2025250 [Vibrio barjaei]
MSKSKTNKHGLSRTIPQAIRKQIRKDSGYGCVMCGSMFCDYEHIEPEYNNAKEHDPKCMTLLCGACHHKVTGRRKSKKAVWEAKAKPFALEHGFVKELIEPADIEKVLLGNSYIESTQVALLLRDKPILWFEKPEEEGEPILVNAIFSDSNGKPTAFLNRNQFTALVDDHDIKSEGTSIEFIPKPRMRSLVLNIEGGKPIRVDRLDMSYLDTKFQIKSDHSMYFEMGNMRMPMQEIGISGCGVGMVFGSVPSAGYDRVGFKHKFDLVYRLARFSQKFVDCNGEQLGWLLGNAIINRNYETVGKVLNESNRALVYSLIDEFIGYLFVDDSGNVSVEMESPEYDTYEPIWISPQSLVSMNIRARAGFDISHRLFGIRLLNNRRSNDKLSSSSNSLNNIVSQPSPFRASTTDKPVEIGDRVTVDFIGYLDGEPFEGGQAKEFPLVVGQGQMIEGFETALIGAKEGDTVRANLTFPKDYHAQNLQNKEVFFEITLTKVESPIEVD